MDASPVVRVAGLVKRFGRVTALDGLDLEVAPGEVHGFLGPNGAGKSTTIRVLLGLLRADAGEVELLGGDPWRDVVALHRRLAYVPGDVVLRPGLSGGEAVDLLGQLRGGLDERRRAELVERFELDLTKRGRQYSKGNRQKVALVAALAARVELLVLDEPTSGLTGGFTVLRDARLDARGRLLATVVPGEVGAALAELVPHGLDRVSVTPASLEAPTLVAWLVGVVGLGALFGTVVPSFDQVVADNPALADLLAASGRRGVDVGAAFVLTLLDVLALLCAVMGVQLVLHAHAEEVAGRLEPLLSGSLRRTSHLAAYAVPALLAPAATLVVGGVALGAVASAQGFALDGGDLVRQLAGMVPSVWVLVAVGVATVGAAPRSRVLAWVGVAATFG